MKKLFITLLAVFIAACATVKKVDDGVRTIGERLSVNIEGAWNHLDFPGIKPAEVWTMEGLTIDEFLVYSGIKDGQLMHPSNPANKANFSFRSTMQREEIVSMFEGTLTMDGSAFKLTKLEPYPFGGKKGFRFEYERIRKIDGVIQNGVGFGAIDKQELFAIIYHAPRLTFFPRHQARVEKIAQSVIIK